MTMRSSKNMLIVLWTTIVSISLALFDRVDWLRGHASYDLAQSAAIAIASSAVNRSVTWNPMRL